MFFKIYITGVGFQKHYQGNDIYMFFVKYKSGIKKECLRIIIELFNHGGGCTVSCRSPG